MKRNIIKYLAFALLAISCSTDVERPVLQGFDNVDPRELTAVGATTFVLDKNNENGTALTLQWGEFSLSVSESGYGVPDESINCFVEFSHTQDFTVVDTALLAKDDNVSFTKQKSFTNDELNLILSKKGYIRDVAADVYTRIRFNMGANKAPRYSNVLKLNVTPYGIIFDRMELYAPNDINDDRKRKSLGMMLYSPNETGIYQGYISGSDWMNFFAMERDQTIWGTVPGSAFSIIKLTDDVEVGNTIYNFWLPDKAGCYFVTVNVKDDTWGAERLSSMVLKSSNGNKSKSLKFDSKTNTWSGKITTTAANESLSAQATTYKWDIENKEGVNSTIDIANLVTIPTAGTWLVTVDLNGKQPTATYVASEPDAAPRALLIVNKEKTNTLCRVYSKDDDGTYTGFYTTTTGWENFYFSSEDKNTYWGVGSDGQFTLAEDGGNLWTNEPIGLRRIWASLNDNIWSDNYITAINVTGTFNNWSQTADKMTFDTTTRTWSADINITADEWGLQILIDGKWSDMFKSKSSGKLGYNEGDNIPVPTDSAGNKVFGKYRLTIDLNDFENMTYVFTKID